MLTFHTNSCLRIPAGNTSNETLAGRPLSSERVFEYGPHGGGNFVTCSTTKQADLAMAHSNVNQMNGTAGDPFPWHDSSDSCLLSRPASKRPVSGRARH
jgi:hypothetical protein